MLKNNAAGRGPAGGVAVSSPDFAVGARFLKVAQLLKCGITFAAKASTVSA